MRKTKGSSFDLPITTIVGSSLRNIRAQKKDYRIGKRFLLKYNLSSIVAGILEIFAFYEHLRWRGRIRKFRLEEPPVFIIGFWRSGTTLLHALMCQDTNFAYTTTFQTVFPNHVLTHGWWLKKLIKGLVPKTRPYDNVLLDLESPQEEEFAMLNSQPFSIYKFFIYPNEFDEIIDNELFTGSLDNKSLEIWKSKYRELIAKSVIHSGGQRYLGKNPCHLTRIRLILEQFPDAKFIFIHRNPNNIVESMYRFFIEIFKGIQLQEVPEGFSREKLASLYTRIMDTYLIDRQQIPAGNLFEVKLDDFLQDKLGYIEAIYRQFGIPGFSQARPAFEKYIQENVSPPHIPDPPEPETIRAVDEQAGHLQKAFGYKEY